MRRTSRHRQWTFVLVLCLAATTASGALLAARAWRTHSPPGDFGRPPAASDPASAGRSTSPVPTTKTPRTTPTDRRPGVSARVAVQLTPRAIRLPRLGVDAAVDRVGVDGRGDVEVPEDARRVGWYRFSPPPGAPAGSTVIVGHVDSRTQGLGVLAALAGVRRDDRLSVVRGDGTTLHYTVTSRRTVPKDALGASGVFRREGRPVVSLVTCTGPYLEGRGGYQDNLIVTAVPED
ncbi:class F sortase [Streptomyces sp. NPDC005574]|uniref:class F sortase n=1 Tax=Streptomyces sp. NPDC005574 TaxID=3156891 RepID=UPI0033A78365